jgi:2-dehydro-3-deoxygluconokinase
MKKVVTLGEILLRFSTEAGKRLTQANQLNINYGGAEANVGVSLANFGYNVYFVSKVPNNALGVGAQKHLRSYGVNIDYMFKGGERLGTYYVETGIGDRNTQIIYDRSGSSISEISEGDLTFDDIFKDVELYHISGITPALSPELKKLTLLSLQKAKEKGITTSFDINYRTQLWEHAEAAKVIQSLLPYVDICSCSERDAIYLLGIPAPKQSYTTKQKLIYFYEEILKKYPNIQLLFSTFRDIISSSENTLQGNLYIKGNLYQSRIHRLSPIVDRVGGGDAFTSGILYGFLENKYPQDTVAFATAASALKHTVEGDFNPFTDQEIYAYSKKEKSDIQR